MIDYFLIALAALGILLVVLEVLERRRIHRLAKDYLSGWNRTFPGNCAVCAFHRLYGEKMGYETPKPHDCPEAN